MPERFSSVATIEFEVPPMSLWKAMTGFLSGDYQSWVPGLTSCLNPGDASKELSGKIYKFSSADNETIEVSLKKFLTDKDSKYYLGEYEIEFSKNDVERSLDVRLSKFQEKSEVSFTLNSSYNGRNWFYDRRGEEKIFFDQVINNIKKLHPSANLKSCGFD